MQNQLDNYVIQRRLSLALFGDVVLCKYKPTQAYVAVKRVLLQAATAKKTLVGKKSVHENIALERELYHRFRALGNHRNVLALQEEFEFDGYLYMVSDYCSRGDLYEIISKTADGKLSVETARRYVSQIARGVQFMHENGYAHRDLSLENVLVTQDDECKVCDLGLAASTATTSTETVGKLLYMAPEVHARIAYDVKQADVWSLGVIFFIMLLGAPPVESATISDVRFKIIRSRGVVSLIQRWKLMDSVPSEAIELLAGMLQPDPSIRFTMEQVLQHPFLSILVPINIDMISQPHSSSLMPTTVAVDLKRSTAVNSVNEVNRALVKNNCLVASNLYRLFRRAFKHRVMAATNTNTAQTTTVLHGPSLV